MKKQLLFVCLALMLALTAFAASDEQKTLGKSSADVKIDMFVDFEDPFSAKWYDETFPTLKRDYFDTGIASLRLIHFPFSAIHPHARSAAIASECAAEQGLFYKYVDALFENRDALTDEDLLDYAKAASLNTEEFQRCIASKEASEEVDEDYQKAVNLRLSGVPTFYVNGEQIVGAQPLSIFVYAITGKAENSPTPPSTSPGPIIISPGPPLCKDSDRGDDFFKRGELSADQDVYWDDYEDYCVNEDILVEMLCKDNGYSYQYFSCASAGMVCRDGECRKEVSTTPVSFVTIDMFVDFECPYCARWYEDVYPTVKEKYLDTGLVSFNMIHFPLSEIHPRARAAAIASECAEQQGRLHKYADRLFENQDELSDEDLLDYAKDAGLDTQKFQSCISDSSTAATVDADIRKGQKAGVDGTPAFFINGEKVSGAVQLNVFIDAIKRAQGKEAPTPNPSIVCTTDYDPVCGSDGKTYSNACMAKAAGIRTVSKGACDQRTICTADCPGVCGTDEKSYCNACVASRDGGVKVAYDGLCRDSDTGSGRTPPIKIMPPQTPERPNWCDGMRPWKEGESRTVTGQLEIPGAVIQGTYGLTVDDFEDDGIKVVVSGTGGRESAELSLGKRQTVAGLDLQFTGYDLPEGGNAWICVKETDEAQIKATCDGCFVDGRCLPIGTRIANGEKRYCDAFNGMSAQKEGDASCQNSYECGSNLCVNSQCVSQGFLQKVMNWFAKLFASGSS